MSIREQAEQALAFKQKTDADLEAAQQALHVEQVTKQCRDWFVNELHVNPDEIVVTSNHKHKSTSDGLCRVRVEDIWFAWTANHKTWLDRVARSEADKVYPPAVRVVEQYEPHGVTRWRTIVTDSSYAGQKFATDLPTLALHLAAVDKVKAKRG